MVHPVLTSSAISVSSGVLRRRVGGKHDRTGVNRLVQTQKVLLVVAVVVSELVAAARLMMVLASVISALDVRITLRKLQGVLARVLHPPLGTATDFGGRQAERGRLYYDGDRGVLGGLRRARDVSDGHGGGGLLLGQWRGLAALPSVEKFLLHGWTDCDVYEMRYYCLLKEIYCCCCCCYC